jgi:hypothetical protein
MHLVTAELANLFHQNMGPTLTLSRCAAGTHWGYFAGRSSTCVTKNVPGGSGRKVGQRSDASSGTPGLAGTPPGSRENSKRSVWAVLRNCQGPGSPRSRGSSAEIDPWSAKSAAASISVGKPFTISTNAPDFLASGTRPATG